MSAFIFDKETVKLYVQLILLDQNNPNLHISPKMT